MAKRNVSGTGHSAYDDYSSIDDLKKIGSLEELLSQVNLDDEGSTPQAAQKKQGGVKVAERPAAAQSTDDSDYAVAAPVSRRREPAKHAADKQFTADYRSEFADLEPSVPPKNARKLNEAAARPAAAQTGPVKTAPAPAAEIKVPSQKPPIKPRKPKPTEKEEQYIFDDTQLYGAGQLGSAEPEPVKEKKAKAPAAKHVEEPIIVELPMDKDLLEESNFLSDAELAEAPEEGPRHKKRNNHTEAKPAKKRHHRYGVAMGVFVLLMALVGVSFLVIQIGSYIYKAATDDSQLRKYDKFLAPVVMQDPAPFETIDGADAQMVMKAALWKVVSSDTTYNTYDESGRTVIPLGDVDSACRALFGSAAQLQPKNPTEESYFTYDAEKNVFYVAPYSTQSSFTPYTVSERKNGNSVFLKVGYVSAADETRTPNVTVESKAEKPKPVKYMEYELKTDTTTGSQYIAAIRTVAEQ